MVNVPSMLCRMVLLFYHFLLRMHSCLIVDDVEDAKFRSHNLLDGLFIELVCGIEVKVILVGGFSPG